MTVAASGDRPTARSIPVRVEAGVSISSPQAVPLTDVIVHRAKSDRVVGTPFSRPAGY
jgi:hypothetical protein